MSVNKTARVIKEKKKKQLKQILKEISLIFKNELARLERQGVGKRKKRKAKA